MKTAKLLWDGSTLTSKAGLILDTFSDRHDPRFTVDGTYISFYMTPDQTHPIMPTQHDISLEDADVSD